MAPTSAPALWWLLVIALPLLGCTSSGASRPDAQTSCGALLDGRGFEGHLLVKQEPEGRPGRFYCVFVEERHRDARPGLQVPARQVVYDSAADAHREAPTTIPVTGDFAQAPVAK